MNIDTSPRRGCLSLRTGDLGVLLGLPMGQQVVGVREKPGVPGSIDVTIEGHDMPIVEPEAVPTTLTLRIDEELGLFCGSVIRRRARWTHGGVSWPLPAILQGDLRPGLSQDELHTILVPRLVAAIIKTVTERGGSLRDIWLLTESVLAGVVTVTCKLGGDNMVLDTLFEGVRRRTAQERLGGLAPEGQA